MRRQEIDSEIMHVKDLFEGLEFIEIPEWPPFTQEFFDECPTPCGTSYVSRLIGHCLKSAQMNIIKDNYLKYCSCEEMCECTCNSEIQRHILNKEECDREISSY